MLALFVEVAALHAEGLGRVGHVIVVALEFEEKRFAFEGFNAIGERSNSGRRRPIRMRGGKLRRLRQSALDGGIIDNVGRVQEQNAYDNVAQFAHISGPGLSLQHINCLARKSLQLPTILLGKLLGEMLDKDADIVAAFAQRREHDGKHENAVI